VAAAFDPFEVLGVRSNATRDEIRAAYREQVARYHPDKHRGNPLEDLAAAKLIEINRAYEVLSDDGRRAAYEVSSSRANPGVTRRPDATSVSGISVPAPVMKVLRSLGLLVSLVLFLRFGMVFARELLVIARGIMLGVLWLVRLNPIVAIAVIGAAVLGAGLLRRSRKGTDQ
jgi:preprotein translocase subunit Sec63